MAILRKCKIRCRGFLSDSLHLSPSAQRAGFPAASPLKNVGTWIFRVESHDGKSLVAVTFFHGAGAWLARKPAPRARMKNKKLN